MLHKFLLSKHTILLIIILFGVSTGAWAQLATIKGKVTTSDGQAAEFVNILVKGTGRGVAADINGYYTIENLKPGKYTIQASFISLKTETEQVELQASETKNVDFMMAIDANQLQEVLVKVNPSRYVADYPSISLRLKSPLIEIPQNIQVINSQLIKDQQLFDMLEGVSRNVSGVTRAEHWDNYSQLHMRGSRLAAFRNGMNIQMPFGPLTEDLSMVERIEFVKGPAGFMLANGEPNGFYNVVTKKPTGISKGEAGLTLGSFNTYRATLDMDGALSKDGKLLYRFNLMGQTKGSHRDFESNDRVSVVPVLKYKFGERSSLTAEYTYQFSKMSMIGSNYAFSKKGYGDQPVSFTTAEPNMPASKINDHSLFLTFYHDLNPDWSFTSQLAYMSYGQLGIYFVASRNIKKRHTGA